jgi:hypothetical protein
MLAIKKRINSSEHRYETKIQDPHLRKIFLGVDYGEIFNKFLSFVVPGHGKLIEELLIVRKTNGFKNYRFRLSELLDKYSKKYEKFENEYSISKYIDEINNNLFIERTKIAIEIIDARIEKRAITFEIYKKLNFENKIRSFKYLPYNWNTYNASKISPSLIYKALRFIDAHSNFKDDLKFVAPLNNGGVQIDFEKNNKRIEIFFISIFENRVHLKDGDNDFFLKMNDIE